MASRPGGGSIADAVSGPVLLSSDNNNRDESLSRLDHASRAANTTLRRKFGFTLISRRGGVVVCTRQVRCAGPEVLDSEFASGRRA